MDVNTSVMYLLDFTKSFYMLGAETFKMVAVNGTLINAAALDIYYLLGFIKYFAEAFGDTVNIVSANSTLLHYNVDVWQKLAGNSIYLFGDYDGRWGMAYIFRKQYECIQPGAYCEGYAGSVTYHALDFMKWLIIAASKIGANLSRVFT